MKKILTYLIIIMLFSALVLPCAFAEDGGEAGIDLAIQMMKAMNGVIIITKTGFIQTKMTDGFRNFTHSPTSSPSLYLPKLVIKAANG